MKVILRADAGVNQGSGHVMRCLTLSEELLARGHEVTLMTAQSHIEWLNDAIIASGVGVVSCELDELDERRLSELGADWVVVDSYRIENQRISALDTVVPVLAIIDGNTRGIHASLYVEQNIGSEGTVSAAEASGQVLAGSSYALVREAILFQKRPSPWVFEGVPHVVAFMGGTDATGVIAKVARQLGQVQTPLRVTVVAPLEQKVAVETELASVEGASVVAPTNGLPAILGSANIVISAAGTSSWDICSLALPSILIAVVENQSDSLDKVIDRRVALGLNLFRDGPKALLRLGPLVEQLTADSALRKELSSRCVEFFDGQGKVRIVDTMERFRRL